MPTSYTQKLMDKGQTFEEFTLTCARAFGACIMMREDDLDKPIPEFEPQNEYNTKELNKAKKLLEKFDVMSIDEQCEYGKKEKEKQIKKDQEWFDRESKENRRLLKMEEEVKRWTPPTPDHTGLKKFMLEQIKISKNNVRYIMAEIKRFGKISNQQYFNDIYDNVIDDIKYHNEEIEKEIKRTNDRNKWVKALKESLNGGKERETKVD